MVGLLFKKLPSEPFKILKSLEVRAEVGFF